ncbi:MAG: hypothetical protein ACI9BD_001606 [Candidatus Marinamargulisbacteria bacterium]|jgi:hypothetical protein
MDIGISNQAFGKSESSAQKGAGNASDSLQFSKILNGKMAHGIPMPVVPPDELEKQRFKRDKESKEKRKPEEEEEDESVYKTILSLRKKIEILQKYEEDQDLPKN